MPSDALTVRITVPEPPLRAIARYSLEEVAVRLGVKLRTTEGAADAIVYGPVPERWQGRVLPYDRRCYEPAARFAAVGSPPLWAPHGTPVEHIDLIGGLARLLTLADESQVDDQARNRHGTFPVAALPPARASASAEPLVEHHVAALGRRLATLAPEIAPAAPLWPAGRRYAVVVTHDTDAAALGAPMEIVFNSVKAIVRRDAVRARMAWDGLMLKGTDPLFGFGTWAELERGLGLRSAFFLYGRGKVRPDLNDCRSSVFGAGVDWGLLRSLAADGWEFGLHPPIRAKHRIDEFLWGKQSVERRLGVPIYGVRHHYWALDWRHPHITFRKHVNAGFRYDSSIAWRDAAGFRAGTCLPYRPFDPGRGRPLDIYELPAAVMDAHVVNEGASAAANPEADTEAATRRALRVAENVRRAGGILMLDWHTEAASAAYCYRTYRPVFMRILATLIADSEAWFATPWDVTRHWHRRRMSLSRELEGAAV
jgi:hypothetical protein